MFLENSSISQASCRLDTSSTCHKHYQYIRNIGSKLSQILELNRNVYSSKQYPCGMTFFSDKIYKPFSSPPHLAMFLLPEIFHPLPGMSPPLLGMSPLLPGMSSPLPGMSPPLPGISSPLPGISHPPLTFLPRPDFLLLLPQYLQTRQPRILQFLPLKKIFEQGEHIPM